MAYNLALIEGFASSPKVGKTPQNVVYIRFSLAVARIGVKDRVDWIPCVLWGKKAETHMDYIKKGRRLLVQGEIHTDYVKKVNYFNVCVSKIIYFSGSKNKKEKPIPEVKASPSIEDHSDAPVFK